MRIAKKHSFQRSIQNAVFLYALIPTLILTSASILLTRTVLYRFTENRLGEACGEAATLIERVCAQYTDGLVAMSAREDIARELSAGSISTEKYQEFYTFVNQAPVRAEFYLLDGAKKQIGGSTTLTPDYLTDEGLQTSLVWQRNRRQPERVSIARNNNGTEKQILFLHSVGDSAKPLGYILFEIRWDDFRVRLTDSAGIMMADQYHYAYWSTDNTLLDSYQRVSADVRTQRGELRRGAQQLLVVSQSASDGSVIVYAYADTTVYLSVFRVLMIVLLASFAGLVALLFRASGHVAKRTGKVVDHIASTMENAQYDALTKPLIVNTGDEFEKIAVSYNRMCGELRRLIDDNAESAKQQVISEIKQLESQFDPHFLFNTLETVRVLVTINPEGAKQAIVALSEILRYSIDNTRKSVLLKEDIHYTECYLLIQKNRFEDRLQYRLRIDSRAEDCVVPKLILQPLAENAVKYGKDADGRCELLITAELREERLFIEVSDCGEPLTDAQLAEIRAMIETPRNLTAHVGLYNVHKRIRLAYGEAYGVRLTRNVSGQGNTFAAVLPVIWKENGHV